MKLRKALRISKGSDFAIKVGGLFDGVEWEDKFFDQPKKAKAFIRTLQSCVVDVFWHDWEAEKSGYDWTDCRDGESVFTNRLGVWLGDVTMEEVEALEKEAKGGSTEATAKDA